MKISIGLKRLAKILIIFIIFLNLAALVNPEESQNTYVVSGEIVGDNLILEPFYYLGENEESDQPVESNYTLDFHDKNQNLLKTYKFNTYDIVDSKEFFYFRVDVPIGTKTLAFKKSGGLAREFVISQNLPELENISITRIDDQVYKVDWMAKDNDRDILSYNIYYKSAVSRGLARRLPKRLRR